MLAIHQQPSVKSVGIIVTVTIISAMFFLSIIGALFLASHRLPTTASSCDRIEPFEGELYCMAVMNYEDDPITVVRGGYEQ